MKKNKIVSAIAMTFCTAGHGWAQEPEADTTELAEATELSPVEVNGTRDEREFLPDSANAMKPAMALRDLPQSATVITRPVIDAQAATSIKDALRYVPGITLSAGEGGQIGDNLNLRGFSARTDVYLDGFRDRGQYTRDTFFLDAVEVLKGPSSMLFGRGSTGGVINQVSKQAHPTQGGQLSATIGTDDYYRLTGDWNQPFSDTSAGRIAVMGQDIQSTRDKVYNEDFGVAPSLRFGIGTPTEVTFSGLFMKNNDLPDYGFPLLTENGNGTVASPIDAPDDNYYGYDDDHFDQDVAQLGTTISHKLSSALEIRERVQYARYQLAASPSPLTVPFGPGAPTQQTPLDQINLVRQDRDRENEDTSLFSQTDLVGRFRSGSVGWTVTGGLELGIDKFQSDGYLYARPAPPTPAEDPTLINLGNPVNGTRSGTRYLATVARTTAETTAVYANAQADLGSDWKAVAGVRWDRFEAESSALTIAQNGAVTLPAQPAPRVDTMVSPRAGLLWQPSGSESYYVSYGTSFNPTAEAVTQTSGANAANSNLDPEKNQSYEVGAKWTLAEGKLELNTALFRVDKTNARYADPNIGGLQTNEGEARVQGFEVMTVGRLTDWWQLIGGYTWLDSEILESPEVGTNANAGIPAEGKRFPNTPEHQATLWNSWQLPAGFEAGAGAVYASKRTLNNFETAETDGYVRADAMAGWCGPSVELRLNLLNAFDELYFDTALGGRATPARGRTLLFTTTLNFGK